MVREAPLGLIDFLDSSGRFFYSNEVFTPISTVSGFEILVFLYVDGA